MKTESPQEPRPLWRWVAGPVALLGALQIFALAPAADWFSWRVWLVHLLGHACVVFLIATIARWSAPLLGRLFADEDRRRDTALALLVAIAGGLYGAEILAQRLGRFLPGALLFPAIVVGLFFGYAGLRRWMAKRGHGIETVRWLATAGLSLPILYYAARKTALLPDEASALRAPLMISTALLAVLLVVVTTRLKRPTTGYTLLALAGLIALRLTTTNPHALRLGPAPDNASDAGGPPIVLIVIDTCRADALDLTDPNGSRTPQLAQLARGADVYTRVVANGSWTLPGHASIFTGLSLSDHRTDLTSEPGFAPRLGADIPTLQEIFAQRGYRTACITGNGLVGPHTKLARGFQRYRYPGRAWITQTLPLRVFDWLSPSTQPWLIFQLIADLFDVNLNAVADETVGYALEEIGAESDRPLYLFLNFMDVHQPYPAPEGLSWGERFALRRDLAVMLTGATDLDRVSRRHAQTLQRYYLGQAPRLDGEIGRVFEALRSRGWYEEALIVVTADHGEAFWENEEAPNYFGHNGAYEPAVRIPLIVKAPGQKVGRLITDYAQQRDILPTMLAHLSLPVPERGDEPPPTVVTEWYPRLHGHDELLPWKRVAVYSDRYKYVVDEQQGESLFDLEAAPHESRSILAQRPEIADELRQALIEEIGDPASSAASDGELEDGLKDQLRALGYLNN